MIQVENLGKRFGARVLFESLGLEVKRGEVVALIGPSGSGKSSLLRCIVGLESFHEGLVRVDGIDIPAYESGLNGFGSPARRIRAKLGMVFQQFNLFPHMTVLENITEAPVQVLKRSPTEARQDALELLGKVNLSGYGDRFPASLSGGEQQRVAIARALAMRPEAMLFDEPTSALDPETVGDVLDVLRQLARDGMTLMIATHEMGFARDVADRVIVFDAGRVVESGPPAEVFQNPKEERTRLFLRRVLER